MTEETLIEKRLRGSLTDAANAIDVHTVRPLTSPQRATRSFRTPLLAAAAVAVIASGVGYGTMMRQDGPSPAALPAVSTTASSTASSTALPPTSLAALQVSLQTAVTPADVDIVIFLCKRGDAGNDQYFPRCRNRGAATDEEKERIKDTLSELPAVKSVRFENQTAAYRNFRRYGAATSKAEFDKVKVSDMPESFRIRLKPDADRRSVLEAVDPLPGISNIVDVTCGKRDWRKC